MVRYYDVSLLIQKGMIVYPGNPEISIKRYSSIPKNSSNESLLVLSSHTGTHVDTQLHIRNDGEGSEALPLDSFYGQCKVIDLTNVDLEIHQRDLEKFAIEKDDIILIKTKNSKRGFKRFRNDFVHLKYDAAEYLVNQGVKTLGFDYLSVKKPSSDYEVHEILINNLTLFEGLDLSKVTEGKYTFLGLPLRIDCDGSPARVILVEED